jgi:hypothetical protein
MTIAFVLGNGVSRTELTPESLRPYGTIYGCNALYREFVPDVLVSTDTPISQRIQAEGYSQKNRMYTRKPLPSLGALRIPQEYFGFSSGPAAVGIAALDRNRRIYMIGFDMGPNQFGKFNNVYADTEFYKKSSAPATYSGNWVRQLLGIMKEHNRVEFVRIVGETTAEIPDLLGAKNLTHMNMGEFLARINNTKEL